MEQRIARQILQTLAQGRNPFSGAALEPDTLLQHEEVKQALLAAAAALSVAASHERRRMQLPENGRRAWTDLEERNLTMAFSQGEPLADIAAKHGRSLTAIEARLENMGLISAGQRVTRNRFGPPRNPQPATYSAAKHGEVPPEKIEEPRFPLDSASSGLQQLDGQVTAEDIDAIPE